MSRKEEIEDEIARLRQEHDAAQGTACEVVQRVCGYYRNVKHFNTGKREEYRQRISFDFDKALEEAQRAQVS